MTEDFKKSLHIADRLFQSIAMMDILEDTRDIYKMAKFTAIKIRDEIPMYTGNINPKWKIYDDVVALLNDKC